MKRIFFLSLLLFFTVILQGQVSKTISLAAGELAANLSPTERATVNNLYLAGTIDARDFKTMRDSMPVLSVIDLSGTTIVEYIGANGTFGDRTYAANHIPILAFCSNATGINVGKTTLTSVQLPEGITAIKSAAFELCSGLEYINLPSSLTTIESVAFFYCGNSLSITIPASTTTISYVSFEALNGYITVDSNNPNFSSEEGVLFNKTKTTIITCPASKAGSFAIPTSVTEIGTSSFSFCNLLTGPITIPSSVTKIGDWAFRDCDALLGSLTIPASVTSIGRGAFYKCISLSSIYAYTSIPVDLTSSQDVFLFIDKTSCNLYVPSGSLSAYLAANQWQDFSNIIEIDGYRLSGNKRSIGADQNSKTTVDLYAFAAWTAYSDHDWLTCTPTNGNYDATLTLTADVNTTASTRIAKVYIECPGHTTHYITVTQAAGPGIAILDDLEIINRTIADQSNLCFGAHNTITVAGNGTKVNFENGSIVNLIAEQSIRFLPGFHSKEGSYTHAYITTNGSFCDQLPAHIDVVEAIAEKSIEAIVPGKTKDQISYQASLKVFPNPNNGLFKVTTLGATEERSEIQVYNLLGKTVYSGSMGNQATSEVSINNAGKGLYVLKVTTGKESFQRKIIIR